MLATFEFFCELHHFLVFQFPINFTCIMLEYRMCWSMSVLGQWKYMQYKCTPMQHICCSENRLTFLPGTMLGLLVTLWSSLLCMTKLRRRSVMLARSSLLRWRREESFLSVIVVTTATWEFFVATSYGYEPTLLLEYINKTYK